MNDLRTLQERLKKLKDKNDHQPNEHGGEDTGHGDFLHLESPPTNTTNTNISNHNEWMAHIADRGHQPEDWLEFLVFLRDKAPFSNAETKYPFIVNIYAKAIKCICSNEPKKNEAFAQLLVDAAQYRQRVDQTETRNMFKFNRSLARRFAFYHVAYAQFELNHGNREKCKKILEWAKEACAEPKELLFIAFQNFLSNKTPLVTKQDLEKCKTGTFQNYTGELSASVILKMETFSHDLHLGPVTLPDIPCTPHMHNQSNNTAPQLSLSGSKINGDPEIAPHSRANSQYSAVKSSIGHNRGDSAASLKNLSSEPNVNPAKNGSMRITPDQQAACGPRPALRSSHSTPDCKGPGVLSGVLSGVSIGKSNFWRVARAGAAPSIRELRNAMVEEEDPGDAANTMELLNVHPLPPTPKRDDVSKSLFGSDSRLNDSHTSVSQGSTGEAPSTVKKASTEIIAPTALPSLGNSKKELQYPTPVSSKEGSPLSQKSSAADSSSDSSILASELSKTSSLTGAELETLSNVGNKSNSSQTLGATSSAPSSVSYPAKPVFTHPASHDSHPGLPSVTKTTSHTRSKNISGTHYPNGNGMPGGLHPLYEMTPRKPDELLVVNNVQYSILKMIGKGGSSKVYRVFDPEKNLKAVKCVNIRGADESVVESYMNEIDLLQRLRLNNWVIRLYDYEYNEEKCILYLVMEIGETDLAIHLRNLKKSKSSLPVFAIKNYWMNMLEAVQGLHLQGIVHADLKPANFVLVAGMLKLIDFGIAKTVPQDMTSVYQTQAMGTLNYMSPEAMMDVCGGAAVDENGRPRQQYKVGVKSDVWSLGCILYFLVHGRTPFQHITNDILKLQAIANPNYAIQFPESEDRHIDDVLKKCLVRDPKQRASIEELLQHPFLKPEKQAPLNVLTPRKNAVLQIMESSSPGTIDTLLNVLKNRSASGLKSKQPIPMENLENTES